MIPLSLRASLLAIVLVASSVFLIGCGPDQFIALEIPSSATYPNPSTTSEFTSMLPTATIPASATVEMQINPSPPSPTQSSVPTDANDCTEATFIADATIPDGSRLQPSEIFLKVWRVQNSGSCAWPGDLELTFVGGDLLGLDQIIPLMAYPAGLPLIESMGERNWADQRLLGITQDQLVDIPMMFQAPSEPGDYRSVWALQSSEGVNELLQIYVQIEVEEAEPLPPSKWSGAWIQRNLQIGDEPVSLFLEEEVLNVKGFFYSPSGELYLIEGGLFDQGTQVIGTFGPPYHDGFPFEWHMTDAGVFHGSFKGQLVSDGPWCGARSNLQLPNNCSLSPENSAPR